MIKSLFIGALLIISSKSYSQFGLYASAVYMYTNANNAFYNNSAPGLGQDIGTLAYQGTDFGLFVQNSATLKIIGAEIKTFKGAADNVCSGTLNYTIYPQGSRPVSPVYSTVNLGFYSDCFAPSCGSFFGAYDIAAGGGCCSAGDQKWQNPGFGLPANIDLTTNPIGTYTLELYYSYTGEDGGNGCGTTKFDNNSNNPVNYTATFTITPTMPVSFGSLGVQNNRSTNKVSWNTFSEEHSMNFNIQRSSNGIDFFNIGEITAAGYSSTVKQYAYVDPLPLKGINYYRIRMNEIGGRFQNSVIVSTVNNSVDPWHIINNPAKDEIRLAGVEKGDHIILLNALGAEITKWVSKDNYANISTSHIANGTYFIKVMNYKAHKVLPVMIIH